MAYNPSSYVDNLRYTLKDFNDILLVAKKIGFENPFLPTEGTATDYVMSVDEEPDTLKVTFLYFGIRQSMNEAVTRNEVLHYGVLVQ